MRNRLIELLRKADDATEVNACDYPTYEKAMQAFYTSIADCLLVNGVIVPPCAVGDTVWEIDEYAEGFKARPMKVLSIELKENKGHVHTTYSDEHDVLARGYGFDDFGEILFLAKEEAAEAMEELKGE